jgi:hypothetical protein
MKTLAILFGTAITASLLTIAVMQAIDFAPQQAGIVGHDGDPAEAVKIVGDELVIREWIAVNEGDPDFEVVMIRGPLREIPYGAKVGWICGTEQELQAMRLYEVRFRAKTVFGGIELTKMLFCIDGDQVHCAVSHNRHTMQRIF